MLHAVIMICLCMCKYELPMARLLKGIFVYLYSPCREHTAKALRYGTHSQGISQFYLHTPRTSANGMTIPAFAFPAEAGTHLSTPEGWKAELALESY